MSFSEGYHCFSFNTLHHKGHQSMNWFNFAGSSKPANTSVTVPKSNTPMMSSLIFYEPRQSLAPTRPKCDSILHLFGAWLFDAALARVKFHNCHRIVPDQGTTCIFITWIAWKTRVCFHMQFWLQDLEVILHFSQKCTLLLMSFDW